MPDSTPWFTPAEVAELIGYTKRGVLNLIGRGKLPAKKEHDRYYIDKEEFFKIYPSARLDDEELVKSRKKVVVVKWETENYMLKSMLSEKDREIEFLKEQLNLVNKEKSQLLDAVVMFSKRPKKDLKWIEICSPQHSEG